VERRIRHEDLSLSRARSVDLATTPCQYGRARWLLVSGLLVSACLMLLGSLGVAPFAAPLRSVARHFNRASTGVDFPLRLALMRIMSAVLHCW